MDLFSVFQEANKIYKKIVVDHPSADVSMPHFETNNQNKLSLNISLRAHEGEEGKSLSIGATNCPAYKFDSMKHEMMGNVLQVEAHLRQYIKILRTDLSCCRLYAQYGELLESLFFKEKVFKVERLARFFGEFLREVGKVQSEYNIRLKLKYPAKIVISSIAHNVNCIYCFSTKSLTISGCTAPEEYVEKYNNLIPFPVTKFTILPHGVSESSHRFLAKNYYGTLHIVPLQETFGQGTVTTLSSSGFQVQGTDEKIDKVLQKLVLTDILDALQDIIIGDSILFCFDPILDKTDIDIIVSDIKSIDSDTRLSLMPGDNSNWWVIEVGGSAQVEDEIINAGNPATPKVGSSVLKPGNDPISQIATAVNPEDIITAMEK